MEVPGIVAIVLTVVGLLAVIIALAVVYAETKEQLGSTETSLKTCQTVNRITNGDQCGQMGGASESYNSCLQADGSVTHYCCGACSGTMSCPSNPGLEGCACT